MKKTSLFVIMTAIAAITGMAVPANAQNTAPYWSLTGNNNASSTSKLGSINAVPLRLFTNNNTRAYIDAKTGNVGIGTGNSASSVYKLYATGSNSGIYGKGSTNYGVFGQGGTYGLYGTGSGYGVYGSSSNGYAGYFFSNKSDGIDAISDSGYYGVWASAGNSGSFGVVGYGDYIGTFGNGRTYGAEGYSYGGTAGVYGEGFNAEGGYFHSTNKWALEARTDSGYYAGVFYGAVWSNTGFFTSDSRLKKNIEEVSNAMSIINKLQPKHYEFKTDAEYTGLHLPPGMHYGLIAQDLEQVLPCLVHTENIYLPAKTELIKPKSTPGGQEEYLRKELPAKTESMDVKAINYNELIPIIIKAMQEQNKVIQLQKDKIEALTQQVNALAAAVQTTASNATYVIKLPEAHLGQNAPNPAAVTTSIPYSNLPAGARAQLLVSDVNGRIIKQMQLSSSNGIINMDVSPLATGTYTCSLFINSRLAKTRAMQVNR